MRQTQERNATGNEHRLLRSSLSSLCNQNYTAIPLNESLVRINIAPPTKRRPNKRSKKNLDGLYEVLAPGCGPKNRPLYFPYSRARKVTVRISDISKFGTGEERKPKLREYINRRGPRTLEKSTEAKIQSHIKEFTRTQKAIVK